MISRPYVPKPLPIYPRFDGIQIGTRLSVWHTAVKIPASEKVMQSAPVLTENAFFVSNLADYSRCYGWLYTD